MAKNKNALQDALDWFGGAASNAGKAVVETAKGFGNAFSQDESRQPSQPKSIPFSAGKFLAAPYAKMGNLWNDYIIFSNKNLNSLAGDPHVKTAVNAIPKFNWTEKIKDNPKSVLDDIGRVAVSIPESLVNSPANTAQGYQKYFEKKGTKGYTWQQAMGDLAQAQDLPLTIATLGQFGSAKAATAALMKKQAGQGILKTSLGVAKIGAKEGLETGLAYGLKGGLEGNRETQNIVDYTKNVGTSTLIGGAVGTVAGGTLSGATYATGAGLNKALNDKRAFNFFKIHKAKDPGTGWSPTALRDAVKKQRLDQTDIGKMILGAANEAEKTGKYVKFSEEVLQPDGKVRVKARTPSRSIDLVDAPTPAGVPVDMRPNHQIALEEAARNNDALTIKYILDNMSPDDPYKAPMESLFRPMAEGADMKTVTSPVGRNPDLTPDVQAKVNPNPVPEGVDKVVYRAVDSTDGRSVLGDGTYFGEAPSVVERYGQDVKRFVIDKKAKLVDLRPGRTLDDFTEDAIRLNRDEFNKLLDEKGGDAALGWVMKKHAGDLGYDGIRADDVAYGTVVFNKEMIRPDTSVPEGTDTFAGVQKMINDLADESSSGRKLVDDPELLSKQLQDDPQSVLRSTEPTIPVKETPTIPKPDKTFSESPGLDQIAAEKPPRSIQATIAETRSFIEKAYDAAVDKFDPIFRTLRKNSGDEEAMRRTLSGWYGVGSKTEGRLQQDFYPIIKRAEKEVGVDALREALIDLGTIERGTRGTFGYVDNVDNAKYGLDVLANKLGPEKMAKLQTFLDEWYEYHRQGTQMAVDAGVISPQHAQNMLDRNQFYVHFDRVMEDVDDFIIKNNASLGSPGSMSKQDVFLTVKGGTQKIKDPIKSAIVDSYSIQAAVERNKVATAAVDNLSAVGQATQITSAENKIKRQSIFSDLAELKPLKNKIERTMKSLTRVGKRLEKTKNDVMREGIKSVKDEVSEENNILRRNDKLQSKLDRSIDVIQQDFLRSEDMKPVITALKDVRRFSKEQANTLLRELNSLNQKGIDAYTKPDIDGSKLAKDLKLEQSVTKNLSKGKPLTAGQVRKVVKKITETTPEGLVALKQKIARIEPKLSEAIDAFMSINVSLNRVKQNEKFGNRTVDSILKNLIEISESNANESIDIMARQSTLPDMTGEISGKRAKSLIEQLIGMDDYTLNRFKQRLGTLDDKTQKVLADIDNYRSVLDQINQTRSSLYDESRLARDASTRGKSVIYRLKGGVKEAWEVDPLVAESLRGLTERQMSGLAKILNRGTKVFRATATGINPDFMIPNIARDLQSAFVNFGVNPIDYVRGVAHYIKKDEVYDMWLRAGGKLSRTTVDQHFQNLELGKATSGKGLPIRSKSVPAALAKMGVSFLKDGGALFKRPKDIPRALLTTLQDLGTFSEQPTRLAAFEKVYNQSLNNGMTKANALQAGAYASQEASANFGRGGYYTPEFNTLYAFLNARIQGLDRLARTVKKDPKGALFRIGMITIAPAIATYGWNRMFPAYYDENVIPQSEKDKNFIIMVSNTPIEKYGGLQYFKIPKGDVGRVANVLESFLAFADGYQAEDGSNQFANAVGSLVAGFSPVDLNFKLGPLGAVANVMIPTTMKPVIEGAMNKNFFTGYDIVPDYKTALPAQYQTNSYTSPTYKWLGERLNISPALLQNTIEGYGTGIAKLTTSALDPAFKSMGYTAPEAKGSDINRMPVVRRFMGGERKSKEEAAMSFEKQANSIDFQVRDVRSAIKRGDVPEDAGYLKIEELQTKQQELLDRSDAMRVNELFDPSVTPNTTTQSSSGSLIPSAYAEANPSDIASLLKADEKKKFQLDRWSMNPTQANATKLGLDYTDSTMWLLSKLPDDVESTYIAKDIYAQKGDAQDAQAMKYIEAGRLTNGKVDKALEQGSIDTDQASHLKDLIKQYKIGKGLLKGKKDKKIKIATIKTASIGRVPTIKLPRLRSPSRARMSSIKSGSLRGSIKSGTPIKPPSLTISEYKPVKIKPVTRIALR